MTEVCTNHGRLEQGLDDIKERFEVHEKRQNHSLEKIDDKFEKVDVKLDKITEAINKLQINLLENQTKPKTPNWVLYLSITSMIGVITTLAIYIIVNH